MKFRRSKPHSAPPFALERRSDDERVHTLALPGYRQTRSYSCGFASTLMIIRYFGISVSASELYQALGTDRSGTRQTAIVRVLRDLGLRVSVRYQVGFAAWVRAIDAGKLIIGYLHDVEHWLVAYGYGRLPERVFVADPRPDQGCEQPWEIYGPRLGGFGIFCSRFEERVDGFSSAAEQAPRARWSAASAQLSLDFGGG